MKRDVRPISGLQQGSQGRRSSFPDRSRGGRGLGRRKSGDREAGRSLSSTMNGDRSPAHRDVRRRRGVVSSMKRDRCAIEHDRSAINRVVCVRRSPVSSMNGDRRAVDRAIRRETLARRALHPEGCRRVASRPGQTGSHARLLRRSSSTSQATSRSSPRCGAARVSQVGDAARLSSLGRPYPQGSRAPVGRPPRKPGDAAWLRVRADMLQRYLVLSGLLGTLPACGSTAAPQAAARGVMSTIGPGGRAGVGSRRRAGHPAGRIADGDQQQGPRRPLRGLVSTRGRRGRRPRRSATQGRRKASPFPRASPRSRSLPRARRAATPPWIRAASTRRPRAEK